MNAEVTSPIISDYGDESDLSEGSTPKTRPFPQDQKKKNRSANTNTNSSFVQSKQSRYEFILLF